jgi:hypothetical protein
MDYFNNLDNEPLNKYKINRCVFLHLDWWLFKFHAISLSFDSPSKTIKFLCNLQRFQLTVFDGLSKGNKIAWNLNDHQSKGIINTEIFWKKKQILAPDCNHQLNNTHSNNHKTRYEVCKKKNSLTAAAGSNNNKRNIEN